MPLSDETAVYKSHIITVIVMVVTHHSQKALSSKKFFVSIVSNCEVSLKYNKVLKSGSRQLHLSYMIAEHEELGYTSQQQKM